MSKKDPIAMARMAPFVSFLDVGHRFNGGPHKSTFPENEESWNFRRENGIEPLSLLWLRFRAWSLVQWMKSGTGPKKLLNWSLRVVRRVRSFSVSGMFPVKELLERSNAIMLGETLVGTVPEKLLC